MVKLTQELFMELDILVRTKAGKILEVERFDSTEMRNRFAYCSVWADWAYENIKDSNSASMVGIISIANQIDEVTFKATLRPEMDWRAVPNGSIYKFVVLHEIGHCLFDVSVFDLPQEILMNPEKKHLFGLANEIRADRYAWASLFPKKPLPKSCKNGAAIQEVESFIRSFKEYFPSEPKRIRPISINVGRMVPVSHAEQGVPWA